MQLLYYQAPLSAVILLLLIPVFEPVSTTITVHWTAAVVVSCQHTFTSIWHCGWQHMVVLYCHLHYAYSYSHLYLLVEARCTEDRVHKQQHLHSALCSEPYMCPLYFLVCLFFLFLVQWHQRTWYCFIVKFFWCNSWAVSVSFCLYLCIFCLFHLFFFSLLLTLFLKIYITFMCSYAQFCALNSNHGMQYSFL